MSVEQVAELQVFAEDVKAFVPAEAFEVGGMDAALHAGGQRAALQAVPSKMRAVEAGGGGAGLHHGRDGKGRDGVDADPGRGRGRPGKGLVRFDLFR